MLTEESFDINIYKTINSLDSDIKVIDHWIKIIEHRLRNTEQECNQIVKMSFEFDDSTEKKLNMLRNRLSIYKYKIEDAIEFHKENRNQRFLEILGNGSKSCLIIINETINKIDDFERIIDVSSS